jgi:hypothetical protein
MLMTFLPNTPDGKWHGYTLLSEAPLGWSASERAAAKAAIEGIGRQSGAAHLITHGRATISGCVGYQ